jgi:hypothetical protein
MAFVYKETKLTDQEYRRIRNSGVSRKGLLEQFKQLGVGRSVFVPELDVKDSTTRQYATMASKWLASHGVPRRLTTRSGKQDGVRGVFVICIENVPEEITEEEEIGTERD